MNKIKIQTDTIYNENCKKDLTIIHFADVHFNTVTKKSILDRIIAAILKENPNYIIITGDLIDSPEITKNEEKIKELIEFLESLAKISKVIISIGNHDVTRDNDYTFFNEINKLSNIHVLNNENYQDNFVCITGFTLPIHYYYNITYKESPPVMLDHLEEYKRLLPDNDKYINIALIHSPIELTNELIKDKLKNYDLILSGHTHDGVVPEFLKFLFPKNAGIISPYKEWFPKVARGKIEQETDNKKQTIIINGGITKLSLRSAKSLNNLNCVYNIGINKVLIKKKRG